jgi:dimethylamine monooxygenase subunit A
MFADPELVEAQSVEQGGEIEISSEHQRRRFTEGMVGREECAELQTGHASTVPGESGVGPVNPGYGCPVLPYDPFTSARPDRWHVGLRPISDDGWLVSGGDTEAQLTEKDRLLRSSFDACVAGVAQANEACSEAAGLVTSWLGVPPPDVAGLDALVAVSRLVSEDLVVMVPGPEAAGGYILGAASLCFPTRWLLADKVGRPLGVVHEPVPELETQIGRSTSRVFESLAASRIVMRTNWSLLDCGDLHQPRATHAMSTGQTIDGTNAGHMLWVRTERQTLRRLPRTGAVLFTIRIFQCRLDELQPELHRPLAQALDGLADSARDYKSLATLEPGARAWLAAHD